MWTKECDISFYRLKEALSYSFYPEYVERLRESTETVHNFARVHQQEGSLRMKRRYDMRSVATTFGSGDLVWLHNPQRKRGILPKFSRPRKGPYAVVERLNDVYRIQRGPRTKPKVVRRDRLWNCVWNARTGSRDHRKTRVRMYTAEHPYSRRTGRSTLREGHPSDIPRAGRSYLPVSGRRNPRARMRMKEHRGSRGTTRASDVLAGREVPFDTGTLK